MNCEGQGLPGNTSPWGVRTRTWHNPGAVARVEHFFDSLRLGSVNFDHFHHAFRDKYTNLFQLMAAELH